MTEPSKPLVLSTRIGELLKADSGRFATPGDNLDGVRNDREAVVAWLLKHKDSPHTFRAYKRHLEALLVWLDLKGLPLTDLTRPQAREFLDWCKAPPEEFIDDPELDEAQRADKLFQPAMTVDENGKKVPVRPLQAKGSPAARNQRLGTLNSLFKYLVDGAYARANPFAGHKAESKTSNLTRRFRSLDDSMFQAVMAEIDALDPVEQARTKLVIIGMVRLAARRGEAAMASVGDLEVDEKGNWWWKVVGKGEKPALVPVHPDVMQLLWAYREAAGKPQSWPLDDPSPLFPGQRGGKVTDNMHYQYIKALFSRAANRLEGASAERLVRASPHWLRHTGLSRLVEVMPIHQVKEIARHSRVDTTATYTTVGLDQLHEANRKAPL